MGPAAGPDRGANRGLAEGWRVVEPGSASSAGARAGRRPRLADVAARAGVSSGLVSLVLRNQPGPGAATRTRVLEAARQLGYRPDRTASLLARRRSRHLGVMMNVQNSFHAELVADIDAAATAPRLRPGAQPPDSRP